VTRGSLAMSALRAMSARLATAALAALAACDMALPICGSESGVVTSVIDGDTVALTSGERVRLLLIDAPESTGSDRDCFGDSATRALRDLVLDRRVELVSETGCDDRFGRRLAYLEVDGHDVGRLLIERGYACVLHLPPSGDERVDDYRAAEAAARDAGRGMWGACEAPCR
jgi:micrococcal nuclease